MARNITVWVQRSKDRQNLMLQWIDPFTGKRKTMSSGTADPKAAREQARCLGSELQALLDGRCDLAACIHGCALMRAFRLATLDGKRQGDLRSLRSMYAAVKRNQDRHELLRPLIHELQRLASVMDEYIPDREPRGASCERLVKHPPPHDLGTNIRLRSADY